MNQSNTTEEVTTIDSRAPQQIVKRITRQEDERVQGDAPQKVFNKKKTIFRSNQIIWYILGLVEVLLVFRVVLKVLGASPQAGFANFIYTITAPLAVPFQGIVGTSVTGNSFLEWSTIIAAFVYLCVAWGLVYLLNLIYPITPKDV